jgi:hypothetical protein
MSSFVVFVDRPLLRLSTCFTVILRNSPVAGIATKVIVVPVVSHMRA